MAHLQLDDNFAEHPKVDALSDPAFRLHVSGLLYCSKHLTDGLIPADRVPRLVPKFRKTALAELMERGMWLSILDGAYEIHDYLAWNPSRQLVQERRTQKAERMKRWREAQNVD